MGVCSAQRAALVPQRGLQRGPAPKAVLAGHGQLSGRQCHAVRDRTKAGEGSGFAVGCGTKQFSRLTAKLIEVGWEGKLGHDVSIAARGPRPGAREDSRAERTTW